MSGGYQEVSDFETFTDDNMVTRNRSEYHSPGPSLVVLAHWHGNKNLVPIR